MRAPNLVIERNNVIVAQKHDHPRQDTHWTIMTSKRAHRSSDLQCKITLGLGLRLGCGWQEQSGTRKRWQAVAILARRLHSCAGRQHACTRHGRTDPGAHMVRTRASLPHQVSWLSEERRRVPALLRLRCWCGRWAPRCRSCPWRPPRGLSQCGDRSLRAMGGNGGSNGSSGGGRGALACLACVLEEVQALRLDNQIDPIGLRDTSGRSENVAAALGEASSDARRWCCVFKRLDRWRRAAERVGR